MADALRRQILEEMRNTLAGRVPLLEDVSVLKLPSRNVPVRPSAVLWISGETKEEDQRGATFSTLEVNVQVHDIARGEDLELNASEWISQVVEALLLDKNRRKLAFNTLEAGNATFVPDIAQPEYAVGMIFNVEYPHAVGRPDMGVE